jgi:hypothetical protein
MQRPRCFLAEAYTARSNAVELEAAAERAAAAAAALSRTGRAIRYVRTVFVSDDEMSFHFFEAEAVEDVTETVRRARIECERIVEADVLP